MVDSRDDGTWCWHSAWERGHADAMLRLADRASCTFEPVDCSPEIITNTLFKYPQVLLTTLLESKILAKVKGIPPTSIKKVGKQCRRPVETELHELATPADLATW